jgi:hypothetical protein
LCVPRDLFSSETTPRAGLVVMAVLESFELKRQAVDSVWGLSASTTLLRTDWGPGEPCSWTPDLLDAEPVVMDVCCG